MSEPAMVKSAVRRHLREALINMPESLRHAKSIKACSLLSHSEEFRTARTIMLYLSTAHELDTAALTRAAGRHDFKPERVEALVHGRCRDCT